VKAILALALLIGPTAYPGVTLGVLAGSSALRRVAVTRDGFPCPRRIEWNYSVQ